MKNTYDTANRYMIFAFIKSMILVWSSALLPVTEEAIAVFSSVELPIDCRSLSSRGLAILLYMGFRTSRSWTSALNKRNIMEKEKNMKAERSSTDPSLLYVAMVCRERPQRLAAALNTCTALTATATAACPAMIDWIAAAPNKEPTEMTASCK